ncbi:MAG TPA: YdcF family protein, partial [Anaerolineales bacterium]
IEIIPAPTDYTVTQSVPQHRLSSRLPSVLISLLPSTEYLEITTRMLKEYFGIFIYKLRGWL